MPPGPTPATLLALLLRLCAPAALALDDGVMPTPPRGWSSWYAFEEGVTQERMEKAAQVLATHRVNGSARLPPWPSSATAGSRWTMAGRSAGPG